MKFSQRPIASAIAARTSRVGLAAAATLAGVIAFTPGHARAESNFVNGAGTATARLNFSIVIPKFLYLQVGTGTFPTSVATIDTILFDMTSAIASIGNATAQSATSGGDISPGAVTARVVGNNFTAATNLSATTTGAMGNGAGGTISWSEISVATPTAITVAPAAASILQHPGTTAAPFADGASTTVSLTPVNRVINQAANWTFSYKNTTVPASGTYGSGGGTNGQVTYTIAMP
jgi:hypothetical protein